MNDDVVRRTISRVIEAMDDVRPVAPYSIGQVVARVRSEPSIEPMLKTLQTIDRQHPGWNLAEHQLRYMKTTTGGILRATDAYGRRTHGRIQFKMGEPAKYFTIVVFTLPQVKAMLAGGRKLERYVRNKNDDLVQLAKLMQDRGATEVGDVWDLWRPAPAEGRGAA